MSLRLLWQTCPKRAAKSSLWYRNLSSQGSPPHGHHRPTFSRLGRVGLASGGVAAASLFYALHQGPVHADADAGEERQVQRQSSSLSSLIRSYVVYTACSIPALVDWSPQILSALMSVPVVSHVTELVVRKTFFDQFVGGDTAHATLPVLERLRDENKGCLFAYSVEVDEEEAAGKEKRGVKDPVHKRIVQEMIRCIEVAADFEDNHTHAVESGKGRKTWVAIKLTALLPDAHALHNLSKYIVQTRPKPSTPIAFPGCPHHTDLDILSSQTAVSESGLSEANLVDLRDLHSDLVRICTKAEERGIRVIIDAEHTWYTPAIDAFTLALMRRFNKLNGKNVQPLIYATYQAYLRRTPEYLAQSFADAEAGGYSLGVKLVRGAYHPLEIASHNARLASSSPTDLKPTSASLSISPDTLPPVWSTKPETDACYNRCAKVLLTKVLEDVQHSRSQIQQPTTRPWYIFSRSSSSPSPIVPSNGTSSPRLGLLFGSHNWDSCKLILDTLANIGLASTEDQTAEGESIIRIGDEVTERVTIGQLYGMADALTDYIVNRTRSSSPVVLKYVPYGALVEVMPYLSRRAIENKSVLGSGGAAEERRRALSEIKKRIFG